MWEILQGLGLVEVNLSRFAHRICFSSARNRRNPDMLADLIRSAAMLRFFQRDRRTLDDETIRLYATPEDFKTAGDIFTALNGEAGSQDAKLTKRESQILDIIDRAGLTEFTVKTIIRLTQIPYQPIRNLCGLLLPRGEVFRAAGEVPGVVDPRPDHLRGRPGWRLIDPPKGNGLHVQPGDLFVLVEGKPCLAPAGRWRTATGPIRNLDLFSNFSTSSARLQQLMKRSNGRTAGRLRKRRRIFSKK